ncbi:MAG: diphthine synthase [Candidatus Diapherotrites archaeon]|uniref:Diphthine synthase n=1 Tax=Candidatus Iainarchaeum sp. TaxID=3101447 RepID=A0A938YTV7_9ARCH|nr:diphthine synthase [Candidatus Diapherotrites archaeon]
MFYLVGIGLKPEHLTLEAKKAIGMCSRVFLDTYTSAYCEGSLNDLRKELGKEVIELDRKGIEEGFSLLLKEAKKSNESIALLVFGNALSATTHVQLLLDAREQGIEAEVVAGISIYNFLGAVGLDQYRFGRTCTIVAPKENYEPESFYGIIERNFENKQHSLCLLDIEAEKGKMMTVSEALGILKKIEKKKGKGILERATLIGLFALGSKKQMVKVADLTALQRSSFALFPQSLVIAAPLTEMEKEALGALHG